MSNAIKFGSGTEQDEHPARPKWRAMARGLGCKCPQCGQGKLFDGFAKCVDSCAVCGEELYHQRADDFPAYINIFVVGHLVVAGFAIVERVTDWSSWVHLAIWIPVTIIMAIAMMPAIKGAVIGIQWANYMHGFGGQDDQAEPLSATGHDADH